MIVTIAVPTASQDGSRSVYVYVVMYMWRVRLILSFSRNPVLQYIFPSLRPKHSMVNYPRAPCINTAPVIHEFKNTSATRIVPKITSLWSPKSLVLVPPVPPHPPGSWPWRGGVPGADMSRNSVGNLVRCYFGKTKLILLYCWTPSPTLLSRLRYPAHPTTRRRLGPACSGYHTTGSLVDNATHILPVLR